MDCRKYGEEKRRVKEYVERKGCRRQRSRLLMDEIVAKEFSRTAKPLGRKGETN